jgi:outer membrane protein OmpA-like peptidoglycan-associated protein
MMTRLSLTLPLCGALALAACTDPANLNPDANYTQQGAIMGGVLGAATGLATAENDEDRGRNALLGAAIGAGAGAMAGNRMDQQAAALRQSISNQNIQISQQGDTLVVTMPQDILFDVDSTEVRGAVRGDLAALAANLNQYPNTSAQIVGHTDNTGDAAYNQDLSVRRAQAVAAILSANGVAQYRMSATGRGEDAPVASNLTAEGRAQNRRVDILISPSV